MGAGQARTWWERRQLLGDGKGEGEEQKAKKQQTLGEGFQGEAQAGGTGRSRNADRDQEGFEMPEEHKPTKPLSPSLGLSFPPVK